MSTTTDWIQAGAVMFSMAFTLWTARQQAIYRHKDLEESARKNQAEHEREEKARRTQMRFQLAEQKRSRLVSNYPKWMTAVNDYVVSKPMHVTYGGVSRDEAFFRAHQSLLSALIALVLDESNSETAKLEAFQDRLQKWPGLDFDTGRAIAEECMNHIKEKLVQWKGYPSKGQPARGARDPHQ